MRNIFIVLTLILLPVIVFAQGNAKKKAYYFYGEQCPHCKNVDEYFQANGIYDKYDITKLEFSNPFNTRLLMKFGDVFDSEFKGSVPAIAFSDKFIVGDQPIIDNFVREIDAAENANELPDPEKIQKSSDKPDEENQSVQESEKTSDAAAAGNSQAGNKNKYFPVLMVALVFAFGGALIYVNRKKS